MLRLPAYLTGFSSRADGSAGIRFTTQELNSADFGLLKENLNTFGHLLFAPNPITAADIPTEHAEDKNKTPSKRLRAVIFLLWKQEGEHGDFETYYRVKVEKLIDYVKAKLDG
jgi:hypothetical protein